MRTWFHIIVFVVWIKQQSSYIIFQWAQLPIHHSQKKKIPSVRNHRPGLDHGLNYDKNGPQMVGSKRKINRQLDFWYNLFKPKKKKNCFYFPKLKHQMEIPFKNKPMCLVSPFFFFQKIIFIFIFCMWERSDHRLRILRKT